MYALLSVLCCVLSREAAARAHELAQAYMLPLLYIYGPAEDTLASVKRSDRD